MEEVLEREPGVRSVALDYERDRLRLQFDPRRVSMPRVQQLAGRLGVDLQQRYDRCTRRVRGIRCADCAERIGHSLAETPGVVRVVVNPAAQVIAVDYDTLELDLAQVDQQLSRAGLVAEPPPASRAAFREAEARDRALRHQMAAMTVVCLAALIVGWVATTAELLPERGVLALYLLSFLAGGFHSAQRVARELRGGEISVDLLMLAAAIGAATLGRWPEGAILLFLFSLSNTLEQYILGRTRRAIEALMDLTPEEALVRRDGGERIVPVEELRPGDIVLVRPAERIAADGVIRAGTTAVDQSPMTGESMPVEKTVGDDVFAGTLNQQGAIELEVTKLAADSTLARMVRLVEDAQTERAQSQQFTEWFGQRYTLGVLAAATLTLLVPMLLLGEEFATAFYRAMTVLVVASPCAVVISIPATILAAITSAARGGVLFKGGAHLERAATLDAVAFDKTGTLTIGRPRVVAEEAVEGIAVERVVQVAASAESLSEHPLARAVVTAAGERGLALSPATELEALVGRGVRAQVNGREVLVGGADLLAEHGLDVPAPLAASAGEHRAAGRTAVFVSDGDQVIGLLAIADTLRPNAAAAVAELRRLGVDELVMLTGDNEVVAQYIAGHLEMGYRARLLPEEKLGEIHALRDRYGAVAMVGDGINDAPSLAAADLGVSLGGTGTDVALETADVVLMADDLRHLPYAIALARRTNRIIRQNLVFAFGVMAVLLGFTFFGELSLPFAVAGHEGSTVLVILNGLRLLAFPRP
jgi:Cd2+/Zn2+-exporting ATPase